MATPLLDQIAAQGNRQAFRPGHAYRRDLPNLIHCADGFKVSVIAGPGCYCTPRPALLEPPLPLMGEVSSDYSGPYTHVEMGFPSERPEPWHCTAWNDGYDRHSDHKVCDGWQVQCDEAGAQDESCWDTVYAYVPVEMVRALLESHGGEPATTPALQETSS